jgi:hypothetical protein
MKDPLQSCRPRNFSKRNIRAWCGGCGIDTGWDGLGEWYTVTNEIWEQAWPNTSNAKKNNPNGPRYFLCIGCLEEKLGRKLTRHDFVNNNVLNRPTSSQSKRLLNRLHNNQRATR